MSGAQRISTVVPPGTSRVVLDMQHLRAAQQALRVQEAYVGDEFPASLAGPSAPSFAVMQSSPNQRVPSLDSELMSPDSAVPNSANALGEAEVFSSNKGVEICPALMLESMRSFNNDGAKTKKVRLGSTTAFDVEARLLGSLLHADDDYGISASTGPTAASIGYPTATPSFVLPRGVSVDSVSSASTMMRDTSPALSDDSSPSPTPQLPFAHSLYTLNQNAPTTTNDNAPTTTPTPMMAAPNRVKRTAAQKWAAVRRLRGSSIVIESGLPGLFEEDVAMERSTASDSAAATIDSLAGPPASVTQPSTPLPSPGGVFTFAHPGSFSFQLPAEKLSTDRASTLCVQAQFSMPLTPTLVSTSGATTAGNACMASAPFITGAPSQPFSSSHPAHQPATTVCGPATLVLQPPLPQSPALWQGLCKSPFGAFKFDFNFADGDPLLSNVSQLSPPWQNMDIFDLGLDSQPQQQQQQRYQQQQQQQQQQQVHSRLGAVMFTKSSLLPDTMLPSYDESSEFQDFALSADAELEDDDDHPSTDDSDQYHTISEQEQDSDPDFQLAKAPASKKRTAKRQAGRTPSKNPSPPRSQAKRPSAATHKNKHSGCAPAEQTVPMLHHGLGKGTFSVNPISFTLPSVGGKATSLLPGSAHSHRITSAHKQHHDQTARDSASPPRYRKRRVCEMTPEQLKETREKNKIMSRKNRMRQKLRAQAISQRLSNLDAENDSLQADLAEQQRLLTQLRDRLLGSPHILHKIHTFTGR